MDLIEKILRCHQNLAAKEIPHAFGGALALAWCTGSARGTIDVDINIFLGRDDIHGCLDALPSEVHWDGDDLARLEADLQHRLWWGHTPLDLFFNSTDYHDSLPDRVRLEVFGGDELPFLSCLDLAVFKVFFDRTKDWADLEAMKAAGTLDTQYVAGIISHYLGHDDPRLERLLELR